MGNTWIPYWLLLLIPLFYEWEMRRVHDGYCIISHLCQSGKLPDYIIVIVIDTLLVFFEVLLTLLFYQKLTACRWGMHQRLQTTANNIIKTSLIKCCEYDFSFSLKNYTNFMIRWNITCIKKKQNIAFKNDMTGIPYTQVWYKCSSEFNILSRV